MKNIHVLPTKTNRTSYLAFDRSNKLHFKGYAHQYSSSGGWQPLNIYITSDEEIKEGDYFIGYSVTTEKKPYISCASEYKERKEDKGKIILTTDQDLIKDGVQVINDEFLEWFVKNPSCEEVEVEQVFVDGSTFGYTENLIYKIIIPKQEPKKKHIVMLVGDKVNDEPKQDIDIKELNRLDDIEIDEMSNDWNTMSKQLEEPKQDLEKQAKRMYSEEDLKEAFGVGINIGFSDAENLYYLTFEEWFEQFKNK